MSRYRRLYLPNARYFFTIVTHHRRPLFAARDNIDLLRSAFRHIKQTHPFAIEAIVILPDHLHSIWRLPEGDSDYPSRWRLIKRHVSQRLDLPLNARGEKPVWQRRYWEHCIRDEEDWRRHMDYIHYNPVKHGLVARVAEWPWSSFHRAVRKGWYDAGWGENRPEGIEGLELE